MGIGALESLLYSVTFSRYSQGMFLPHLPRFLSIPLNSSPPSSPPASSPSVHGAGHRAKGGVKESLSCTFTVFLKFIYVFGSVARPWALGLQQETRPPVSAPAGLVVWCFCSADGTVGLVESLP